MTPLKSLLSVAFLTLAISGCSDDTAVSNPDQVFKIQGAFGLVLGEKAKGLPEGYLENNKAFSFTPTPSHASFIEYTYSVTPNTQLIYGIKVKSQRQIPTETCIEQRDAMIKEVSAKLGDISTLKVTEKENQWRIREDNKREIKVDCESSLTAGALQLVMTYSDTALSKLSFVEWSKHQDDITKPQ